jgi:aryl-alcohol dehydrogenase-like predicted oxidoreductase
MLAYSPLAFGMLSGKYIGGIKPPGSRLALFDRFIRYGNPYAEAATEAYVALAKQHGLQADQMAQAFVNSRPFMTSNIIGATSMEQLRSNIDSIHVTLSPQVLEAIEAIHHQYCIPSP